MERKGLMPAQSAGSTEVGWGLVTGPSRALPGYHGGAVDMSIPSLPPLSPSRTTPIPPQTQSGQCGSPQAGPGYEATKERCHQAFRLSGQLPQFASSFTTTTTLSHGVSIGLFPIHCLLALTGNVALHNWERCLAILGTPPCLTGNVALYSWERDGLRATQCAARGGGREVLLTCTTPTC